MSESYFDTTLIRNLEARHAANITIIDPKYKVNEVTTVTKALEKKILFRGLLTVGLIATIVMALICLNFDTTNRLYVFVPALFTGLIAFLDSRIKYEKGRDFYDLLISSDYLASTLSKLSNLAKSDWLTSDESREVAALLIKLREGELSQSSTSLNTALENYLNKAEERKNNDESKIVDKIVSNVKRLP